MFDNKKPCALILASFLLVLPGASLGQTPPDLSCEEWQDMRKASMKLGVAAMSIRTECQTDFCRSSLDQLILAVARAEVNAEDQIKLKCETDL